LKNFEAQNVSPELAEKKHRMQQFMAERGLHALLLARHENIAWATAGTVELRIGVPRETGAGSLLFTKEGKAFYLTTNNEFARQSAEEFASLDYEAVVNPWYANDVVATVAKLAPGTVGSDTAVGAASLVQLAPLRYRLTPTEVERYRWLGAACAEAATEVVKNLRVGMTETEMQTALAGQLLSRNVMPSVYLTAVDDRIRRYRHAVPRAGVLDRFGMVNFCARRWGLCVSMTRFVHFGAMPAELAAKFEAVAMVNAKLWNATSEGRSADELFHVAKEAYAAEDFAGEETMHHQGGATGYAEREWVARPDGGERLLDGQAVAWNPSLQGAKVEDTAILAKGAIEIITETPGLPWVDTSCHGTVYRSAAVLQV
jgi:Xaa-Pro dipeptidase